MRHILITRFGAMGDLLLSTPTVRALRRRWPQAELTYIVGRGLGDILSGHPDLAEVIEFDKREDTRPRRFLALAGRLRSRRYELVLNLQRSVKTVLLGAATGAPSRLTYRRDHALRRDGRMQHAIDNFLHTVAPLGIDPARCDRHLDFVVPPAAQDRVQQLLHDKGVAQGEPLVLINPGASAASRQWPAAHLASVLDHLAQRRPDLRLALIGGRGADQRLAHDALAGMKSPQSVLDLVAAVDLKQTGALLQRAHVLVTMDTGPMHMAAALGTPLVALFGATAPDRTGPAPPPPGSRGVPPLSLVHREGLDCVPCHSRQCKRVDQACLTGHRPEKLLAAIERQLVAGSRPPMGTSASLPWPQAIQGARTHAPGLIQAEVS